ncbi:MAG: hypothetical protein AAF382_10690 [Pseudomonadota bacterium]
MTVSKFTPPMLRLDMEKIDANIAGFRELPLHPCFERHLFAPKQEAFFDESVQVTCPVHGLSKPGDLFTGPIGRNAIVVTRDTMGARPRRIVSSRKEPTQFADGLIWSACKGALPPDRPQL